MNLASELPFSVIIFTVIAILIVIFAGIKLVNLHPKAKKQEE